jgi:16S rRNA (uracil1498-N3)-methyltransferase
MRLSVNDPVVIFNGEGQEHEGVLQKNSQGHWQVAIGGASSICPDSPLRITLVQGISRSEKMDYAIQKATELGVSSIQPVACERSVVKLNSEQAERRLEHWQAVAIASAEQSKRHSVPKVSPIISFDAYLSKNTPMERILLSPQAERSLRQYVPFDNSIELIIGPEGGLSDSEITKALLLNVQALRLGPRVLRTETAAAAAITALQILHGDLL